jgi:predicted DNA-binding transcriptional regulator AlpA
MIEKVLVTYPELRAIGIRFSRAHLNRLVNKGAFPKPIRLGPADNLGKAYWRVSDLLTFIEERAVASGHAPSQPNSSVAADVSVEGALPRA